MEHHTLFISDLHLEADEPGITAIFLKFLRQEALQADALYILGDLFEAWIGDDDLSPFNREIMDALKQATQSGLPVYFMRGNRDFLIGKRFAKKTGILLLEDPTVIDLYGKRILLMHGDSLCTLDRQHLFWRKISLNPCIQQLALGLPLTWRRKIGRWLRKKSKRHQSYLEAYRMDVSSDEVVRAIESHQAALLIHGHTHQPGIHGRRIVLGAWHEQGNALCWPSQGECQFKSLPAVAVAPHIFDQPQ